MFWPSSISRELGLPVLELPIELNEEGKTYDSTPHLDKIIDLKSSSIPNGPYTLITYRGIYLFHSLHHSPLNCHLRSNESIKEFGKNGKLSISSNGKFISIKTDLNYLLVYSIQPQGTDKEVLMIYSKTGQLIQNGYPITNYHLNNNGRSNWGINTEINTSLVNGIIQTFLGNGNNEKPNKDINLRLKFILNCLIKIFDFTFIDNETILTVQEDIKTGVNSVHLIKFRDKSNYAIDEEKGGEESNSTPIYVNLQQLDWFNNEDINGGSKIIKIEYSHELDLFIWFNEKGDAILVKMDPSSKNLNFFGKIIYKSTDNLKGINGKINFKKSLIYIMLDNGDINIYKLKYDTNLKLLKIIKKPINSKNVKGIELDPLGSSIIVLFENGWNIYSFLGNLNFSSFDYDNLNLINFDSISFLGKDQMVLSINNRVINIKLTNLNMDNGSNFNSLKRPVLYSNDKITIFKLFEKKLFDQHHFNYNINDIMDKDTNIWLSEMLPLNFRLGNSTIKSISVSDDGNNVCIIGDYDVIYYNINENLWKTLEIGGEIRGGSTESNFERLPTPINSCIWWENYLIMSTKTKDKSEVVIFSNKIIERGVTFDFPSIIWIFNFDELNENFINFNVDNYNNELLVMTDELNCYSWKLDIQDNKIRITKYIIYKLKDSFPKNSITSIIENFNSIYKMNESDLLILSNTDLYFIQRVHQKSICHLINESVEFIMKLNSTSFAIFNGGEILRFNLANEKDLLKCIPIKLSIGNDIQYSKEGIQVIKSTGTTSYPITIIWFKNIVIGLEVEFGKNRQMTFDTVKHNYLNDLVDHYIKMNIGVINDEDDRNALSIIGVYNEFHKAKNFKFVLERILVDYIQKCDEDKGYDLNGEYFEKLNDLINMTMSPYEIILNCLKKSEMQYWSIFFDKSKKSPRDIVNKLFDVDENYHLAAHFLIIMMNYEQKLSNSTLSNRDIKLTSKILLMLIVNEDFETSFALMRFIKVIDEKIAGKLYEKLKYKISSS